MELIKFIFFNYLNFKLFVDDIHLYLQMLHFDSFPRIAKFLK